jgi:hypothetical protein
LVHFDHLPDADPGVQTRKGGHEERRTMLPRPDQLAARIAVVKKFLQVLWFWAPVLLLNLFRDIFPAARCVLLICFLSTTNTPQLAAGIFYWPASRPRSSRLSSFE